MYRISRRTGADAVGEMKRTYRKLLTITRITQAQARQVWADLRERFDDTARRLVQHVEQFFPRLDQVVAQTVCRVIDGEAVSSRDKIASPFKPHRWDHILARYGTGVMQEWHTCEGKFLIASEMPNVAAAEKVSGRRDKVIKARRIVFTGKRQAQWQEFELPEQPGPQEVLLKTLWSAISAGTETAIYAGAHIGFRTPGARYPRYPYLAGYAATGRILAIGSEVQGLQPGEVVAYPGKHATYGICNVHATPLIQVPENVPQDLAALTRLGTISLNGIRLARIGIGDTVAVFGAGLIGQFAAQFAQLAGGFPVVSIDRLLGRLEQAKACGISRVVDVSAQDAVEVGKELTTGRGFDVVVEATGAGPVVAQALALAATYGKVVLLGSPRGRVEIDPYHHIHSPGVTVIGAHMRTTPGVENVASRWTEPANAQLIMNLLAANKLVVAPLISHRVPMAEALATYEGIVTHPEEYLGVLLDWREETR